MVTAETMAIEYWRERAVRTVMKRWIIVDVFTRQEDAEACLNEEKEWARQYQPSPEFKIETLPDGRYQVLQQTE